MNLNALVLGGGGPVGTAWMSALLDGLVSAGLPVAESDVVLGTSAGSVVGSWLTTRPTELPALAGKIRKRAAWHASNAKTGYGDPSLLKRIAGGSGRTADEARSIAQAAIAAIPPISADQAEAMWTATVPAGPWSPRFRAASVNADTGLVHAWSAQDGIPLAVAAACSTAAPGVAPPVAVAGSVWVDGGVRSNTNADLLLELGNDDRAPIVTGPGKVLILTPVPSEDLAREKAVLVEHGHRVHVLTATRFYTAPTDLLDPAFIDIATTAGAGQAQDVAAELKTWWDD